MGHHGNYNFPNYYNDLKGNSVPKGPEYLYSRM